MHLCAVAVNSSGRKGSLWIQDDSDSPVVISLHTQSNPYFQCIERILQYMKNSQWQQDEIEIHIDNLYVYNVLQHYITQWAQQSWHTSKNEIVKDVHILRCIYSLLKEFKNLHFKTLSGSFAKNDMALQSAKTGFHDTTNQEPSSHVFDNTKESE